MSKKEKKPDPENWWTPVEVAEELGITRERAWQLMSRGEIESWRHRNRWFTSSTNVAEYTMYGGQKHTRKGCAPRKTAKDESETIVVK